MDSKRLLVALLASTGGVQAQFGGFGGGDGNPFSSFGSGSGSSSGSGGSGSGSSGNFGNFQNGVGFDIDAALRARAIHGILGALAMVVLFPLGSILMRVIPGCFAIWIHALVQIVAYVVYITAVAMGVYLVREVRLPVGGDLMSNPNTSYHPIIGIVVLLFLFLQPFLGIIHHAKFKKLQRRQIWSYLHIFNGRIFITLGIANGALGLYMAEAKNKYKTAYIAVGAVMWALWMLSAGWGEWKRWRTSKTAARNLGMAPTRKSKDGEVAF